MLSVQFSHSVMSDSLRPHESQHARPPCPSPSPRVYSNPCPLSWWCHPTISSSVIPFPSCPQSFPASGSFQVSQFFTSSGQSNVYNFHLVGFSSIQSLKTLLNESPEAEAWSCPKAVLLFLGCPSRPCFPSLSWPAPVQIGPLELREYHTGWSLFPTRNRRYRKASLPRSPAESCWGLVWIYFCDFSLSTWEENFVVVQASPPLSDTVDCSMPGFLVLQYLPEFDQTHVHWVDDAVHLSHPLSPAFPAFNLSQHQDLFQCVGISH